MTGRLSRDSHQKHRTPRGTRQAGGMFNPTEAGFAAGWKVGAWERVQFADGLMLVISGHHLYQWRQVRWWLTRPVLS